MANAVTINNKLIDEAIEKLDENLEADSAVTVSVFNMYSPLRARKLNDLGFLEPFVPLNSLEMKSHYHVTEIAKGMFIMRI